MRSGFLVGMVALGAIVVFALIAFSPTDANTSTSLTMGEAEPEVHSLEPETQGEARVAGVVEEASTQAHAVGRAEIKLQGESDTADAQQRREAYLASRSAELEKLARSRDATALEAVLVEVRNPDADIRQAALEAISLSGNRDAIPRLQELAAQTQNAAEKEAILEAAEFLQLPTLTEVIRKQREKRN